MHPKIKKAIYDFATFSGALLFILLVLEILIRIFYSPPLSSHKLFTEYDSLLGWRKIPNITGKHVTSEYTISERMNSKGIRGPDYSYEKNHDEYRIFVLGDSFAEGYTVEFHDLCSEVLKIKLNAGKSDKHYEVINAGTGGYSTDQELLLFQTEGKKYSPDLTILMFYDNDVWYNNRVRYWRGYKPRFQLNEDGTLRVTNVPVPKPDLATKGYIQSHVLGPTGAWLYRKSCLYRFVSNRLKRTSLYTKTNPLYTSTNYDGQMHSTAIPQEFSVYQKQASADVAEAWKITEAILIQLKKETISIGSKLLVFYVPMRAGVYLKEWNKMKNQYSISDENWAIEQVRDQLVAICERNDIDCLDPLEKFRVEANNLRLEGKRLYFANDGHWNAIGHQFVGEMLARYIGETYLTQVSSYRKQVDTDSNSR